MDEILAKYLDSSPQLTADELLKSKADAYNSLPGSLKLHHMQQQGHDCGS